MAIPVWVHLTSSDSLEFEPHFEKYMKSAFSLLGLCIWNWEEKVHAGTTKSHLAFSQSGGIGQLATRQMSYWGKTSNSK